MTKPPGVETISAVEPDVIVAGAGIAGLAAARTLAEAGLRVLLIEASERVGGRLRTEHVPGLNDAIELGAEFVHGRPPRLLALIEEAGLHLEELEGRAYCPSDQRGKLSHCPENRAFHVLEQLERDPIAVSEPDRDESFAAWLQRQNVDAATRESATGYVEGFNAADATLMSIQALARQQSAETEIENDRAFHIVEGYTALADYVHRRYQAAGGKTLLETCVEAVSRHNGRVNLEVRSKSFGADTERTGKDLSYVLTAKKVVVALPLGVLLSGRVRFEPAANVLAALDSLAMGPVHRRTLVFRERFWASFDHSYGDMHFLFSPGQVPPVWWTRSPSTSAVLTAWMGGASSFQVQHEVFAARVLQTLGETFQIGKDELRGMLISSHAHDWNSDPFCLGAYSYVRKGGLSRSRSLSKPEAGTLFFAGEHTDTSGHWGTVHGALASGLRAAAQVLAES